MPVFGNLNIILHGLLFLELKASPQLTWLEITAPNLSGNHDLLMGTPGNLVNVNGQQIHWETLSGLTGGSPQKLIDGIPLDVPDSILQFDRNETNTGNIDKPNGDQGKIFLPWPAHWDVIRRDNRPAMGTRLPMKSLDQQVHTSIERRCGNTIGVCTVLSYTFSLLKLLPIPGWTPTANVHIYFQPQKLETNADVNNDLRNASFQLFSSDNFDLAMVDTGNNASTPIGRNPFPPNSGLSIIDELSLAETVSVVDPKTIEDEELRKKIAASLLAIQDYLLSILLIEANPLSIGFSGKHNLSGQGQNKIEERTNTEIAISMLMASPANCPTLFLGGS